MQRKELVSKIEKYLNEGFSKSELARQLEISRSTLINFLNEPNPHLSKSTLGRISHNLNWLDRSHGHELMEFLVLFMLQRQNVVTYIRKLIDTSESLTGFTAGYHGITYGGPSGFLFLESPGVVPIAELAAEAKKILPENTQGRTETYTIATDYSRYKGNHDAARVFYEQHPNARIFLKLFKNHSFTAKEDIDNIISNLIDKKQKDDVFLLEAGMITGAFDSFMLLITKDENTYTDLQIRDKGIYSITASKSSINESKTLFVTGKKEHCFDPGEYSLSSGL